MIIKFILIYFCILPTTVLVGCVRTIWKEYCNAKCRYMDTLVKHSYRSLFVCFFICGILVHPFLGFAQTVIPKIGSMAGENTEDYYNKTDINQAIADVVQTNSFSPDVMTKDASGTNTLLIADGLIQALLLESLTSSHVIAIEDAPTNEVNNIRLELYWDGSQDIIWDDSNIVFPNALNIGSNQNNSILFDSGMWTNGWKAVQNLGQ